MSEGQPNPFDHSKNIVVGMARLIYVEGWHRHPSGWALPGNRFTESEAEARFCAEQMDKIMRRGIQPVTLSEIVSKNLAKEWA